MIVASAHIGASTTLSSSSVTGFNVSFDTGGSLTPIVPAAASGGDDVVNITQSRDAVLATNYIWTVPATATYTIGISYTTSVGAGTSVTNPNGVASLSIITMP